MNSSQPKLTRREVQICELLAGDLCDKEISQRLRISENTTNSHLRRIFKKLGVRSRTGAAVWFVTRSGDWRETRTRRNVFA